MILVGGGRGGTACAQNFLTRKKCAIVGIDFSTMSRFIYFS